MIVIHLLTRSNKQFMECCCCCYCGYLLNFFYFLFLFNFSAVVGFRAHKSIHLVYASILLFLLISRFNRIISCQKFCKYLTYNTDKKRRRENFFFLKRKKKNRCKSKVDVQFRVFSWSLLHFLFYFFTFIQWFSLQCSAVHTTWCFFYLLFKRIEECLLCLILGKLFYWTFSLFFFFSRLFSFYGSHHRLNRNKMKFVCENHGNS